MGNSQDKSSRGQPLGTSQSTLSTSDQQIIARENRNKLVQTKAKPKELEHKEKILNILEQADNKKVNDTNNKNNNNYNNNDTKDVPIIQSTITDNTPISNNNNNDNNNNNNTNNDDFTFSSDPLPSISKTSKQSSSSGTMSTSTIEPSTREAIAAEQRIKMKNPKQIGQDRKNRTMDLLFGDALKSGSKPNEEKDKDDNDDNADNSAIISSASSKDDKGTKSNSDIFVASGKAAEAAMNRVQTKQAKVQDRKLRTIELLHGDALKDENDVKVAPRDTDPTLSDLSPNVAKIHQTLLNLQNCNPHDKMPATAKLLHTVVSNLLSAETNEEKERFGKLRLSNPKIKAAFIDMECGMDVLESIGFVKQTLKNKENVDEEFMVFDFESKNDEGLWHVINIVDMYYPDAK